MNLEGPAREFSLSPGEITLVSLLALAIAMAPLAVQLVAVIGLHLDGGYHSPILEGCLFTLLNQWAPLPTRLQGSYPQGLNCRSSGFTFLSSTSSSIIIIITIHTMSISIFSSKKRVLHRHTLSLPLQIKTW